MDHYTSVIRRFTVYTGRVGALLGPPTFDMINIKAMEWDEVKSKLAVVGKLSQPDGLIPQKQLDLFNVEDFLCSVCLGRRIPCAIDCSCAQHELRQELIPGLNREDTGHYMQTAFLMAMLDVVSTAISTDELRGNIKTQATKCYGVPADYKHTTHFIDGLIAFVQQVDQIHWTDIHGPKWLTAEQWAAVANPKAIHTNVTCLSTRTTLSQ